MPRKVTVYSVTGCYKCRQLISNLKSMNINVNEVNCLTLNDDEMTKLGLTGVPSMSIDGGHAIYAATMGMSKLKELLDLN